MTDKETPTQMERSGLIVISIPNAPLSKLSEIADGIEKLTCDDPDIRIEVKHGRERRVQRPVSGDAIRGLGTDRVT